MRSEEDIKKLILTKKCEIDTLDHIYKYRDFEVENDNNKKIRKLRNEINILEEILYF
jgi:hypothetical protein